MPYQFCSTQVNLPLILQSDAVRCGLELPQRILAGKGLEKIPHVTILYGLKEIPVETIRGIVRSLPAFTIEFGRIQRFDSKMSEEPLYIEVKDAVGNGGLSNLRKRLMDFIDPSREEFKKYKPHVTLAYVKPGSAEHLIGQPCLLTGKTLLVNSIMYCEKGGTMHECSLKLEDTGVRMTLAESYNFLTERIDV